MLCKLYLKKAVLKGKGETGEGGHREGMVQTCVEGE
jgi:hypothetical protein